MASAISYEINTKAPTCLSRLPAAGRAEPTSLTCGLGV